MALPCQSPSLGSPPYHWTDSPPHTGDYSALGTLSHNLESLLSPNPDTLFSDAIIHVQGRAVPVHRCILAARCPFFRALFSGDEAHLKSVSPQNAKNSSSKLKLDLQRLIDRVVGGARVGFEAFMVVLGFLYSGKLKTPVVACIDDLCTHEACRPAVDLAVEMLIISFVFNISELTTLWEHLLINMVEKAEINDVLHILVAAQMLETISLQLVCTQIVATSNLDIIDLEKHLPSQTTEEIHSLRIKLGLLRSEAPNSMDEKQCRRIQKALDSDDVELVQLLLKEGRISLDGAFALHYAAVYCDPHILQEILELGLADPNLRDRRGYTVLHVAVRRRDPTILVALLTKGANPLELTPDGRTALQLSRRLTRSIAYHNNQDAGEELQRDNLCIEILEQAGKANPFSDTPHLPAAGGKDLFMRLLYLENRVALARLLFPREAKVVMGITHLEATSEFTGLRKSQNAAKTTKDAGVDLNQTPANAYVTESFTPINPYVDETLLRRMQALQKTVDIGSCFFPRCTGVLNTFIMDDDSMDLTCLETGSPDEQKIKRKRYSELKSTLADAFQRDVAAMDKQKSKKVVMQLSSTSSSSSIEDAKVLLDKEKF